MWICVCTCVHRASGCISRSVNCRESWDFIRALSRSTSQRISIGVWNDPFGESSRRMHTAYGSVCRFMDHLLSLLRNSIPTSRSTSRRSCVFSEANTSLDPPRRNLGERTFVRWTKVALSRAGDAHFSFNIVVTRRLMSNACFGYSPYGNARSETLWDSFMRAFLNLRTLELLLVR